jgi:hypothetical protein
MHIWIIKQNKTKKQILLEFPHLNTPPSSNLFELDTFVSVHTKSYFSICNF